MAGANDVDSRTYGLAFVLAVFCGLTAVVGGSVVLLPCVRNARRGGNGRVELRPRFLAAAMGLTAGAMMTAAMLDTYVQSIKQFHHAGHTPSLASAWSALSAVVGVLLISLLNAFLERLEHHGSCGALVVHWGKAITKRFRRCSAWASQCRRQGCHRSLETCAFTCVCPCLKLQRTRTFRRLTTWRLVKQPQQRQEAGAAGGGGGGGVGLASGSVSNPLQRGGDVLGATGIGGMGGSDWHMTTFSNPTATTAPAVAAAAAAAVAAAASHDGGGGGGGGARRHLHGLHAQAAAGQGGSLFTLPVDAVEVVTVTDGAAASGTGDAATDDGTGNPSQRRRAAAVAAARRGGVGVGGSGGGATGGAGMPLPAVAPSSGTGDEEAAEADGAGDDDGGSSGGGDNATIELRVFTHISPEGPQMRASGGHAASPGSHPRRRARQQPKRRLQRHSLGFSGRTLDAVVHHDRDNGDDDDDDDDDEDEGDAGPVQRIDHLITPADAAPARLPLDAPHGSRPVSMGREASISVLVDVKSLLEAASAAGHGTAHHLAHDPHQAARHVVVNKRLSVAARGLPSHLETHQELLPVPSRQGSQVFVLPPPPASPSSPAAPAVIGNPLHHSQDGAGFLAPGAKVAFAVPLPQPSPSGGLFPAQPYHHSPLSVGSSVRTLTSITSLPPQPAISLMTGAGTGAGVVGAVDDPLKPGLPKDGATDSSKTAEEDANSDERLGFASLVSLLCGNIPEGMAVFVSTVADSEIGAIVAAVTSLQSLVKGLAIALNVYYNGSGYVSHALFASFLASLAPALGALLSYFCIVSAPTASTFGVMFGLVSGALIWITIIELFPTAYRYDPKLRVVPLAVGAGMTIVIIALSAAADHIEG